MKELLPEEDLLPTHTPFGVNPEWQRESLRTLRSLENEGRHAEFRRNDYMYAQALSTSLSRPDMARAIGVSRSRVDQILRAHHDLLQTRRNRAAAEATARHLPGG
jgi:hypothetical protein